MHTGLKEESEGQAIQGAKLDNILDLSKPAVEHDMSHAKP